MINRFFLELSPQELDVGLCVSSGQVFRWDKVDGDTWVGAEGDHWYRLTGREGGVEVESNGLEEDLRSLFRLDWPTEEIRGRLLAAGPELEPFMEQLPGLRLLRPSDPVETFFCFLCTPNNNVARIRGLVRHLAAYGPTMSGSNLNRFPTAERIAEVTEQELRANAFGYRGGTIPRIAAELIGRGGPGYLDRLRQAPYEEAHVELCSFHGIGPKLADCIALFALNHTEAVPVDTHLWQAAVRLYFPQWEGSGLTHLKYREIGSLFRDRFGDLAGWAHQYLFYENLLNWRTRR